jgi:hypothetical protein
MSNKSQKERILNAMLKGQKLTCLDSLKRFDCLNLRNRIVEIIRDGKYKITKAWKVTKSKKRVRVYSIDI